MLSQDKADQPIVGGRLRRHFILLALAWTIAVGLSLWWSISRQQLELEEMARLSARVAFEKDVIYRRWNSENGGVYAVVSQQIQPNPYLDPEERDIVTPDGKHLTRINAAYMTRIIHEMAEGQYGLKSHITSLDPIRPQNAPDPWEKNALVHFEKGGREYSEIQVMEGKEYMRLMRPLITEKSCFQCHSEKRYQEGSIRGGISIAIPLELLQTLKKSTYYGLMGLHALVWGLGLAGIGTVGRRLKQELAYRKQIETERIQRERLEGVLEMAGAVSHELNQPLQAILGYAEIVLMHKELADPLRLKLEKIVEKIEELGAMSQKIMKITRYETKPYPGKRHVIDIEKASTKE